MATPGPWVQSPKIRDAVISLSESGDGDERHWYGGKLVAENILLHDCPLISAAPELLAALQDCVERLEQYEKHSSTQRNREILGLARAAIAKAEGR